MAEVTQIDPVMTVLQANKDDGYEYRKRREPDWLENYTLYRDKVTYNRLTQRQSVNLPMMKQMVRSLLKDVDDMPLLYLENLDNDDQKEQFQNEYWKWTVEQNRMDLQDIVDKKQVFLYGRSFDQWQIMDGAIKMTVQDPQDILVSRYTDPTNLHSSRYLIHTNIFVTLSDLRNNPDYDQDKVKSLESWYQTAEGVVKVATNAEMVIERNKKMESLGVEDVDNPTHGETMVELTLHFVYDGDPEELYLKVEAENQVILMSKPLEEVIGETKDHFFQTHFPYVSWADDVERQDFWSDGIADVIRTPNKVVNSWFSQIVENRTLRNFGMHYYDSRNANDFQPATFNPQPWGWYPIPGKPSEFMQKVEIPDLGTENMDELNFVFGMAERASGASATQQGQATERKITLGEVQLALGEAKERIKGMSKFYTRAWKDRGEMFLKLIEAAHDQLEPVRIYKKGRNTTKIYGKEIAPPDWMSKSGYNTRVWSQDERTNSQTDQIQKLAAAMAVVTGNSKLVEITQRKMLEYAGLTPDEISEVMDQETQKAEAAMGGSAQPGANPNTPSGTPVQPMTNVPPGMPPTAPGVPAVPPGV